MAAKDIDTVFKALSDPSRRELLDRLHAKNGQSLTDLCQGLDMARQSVTQHLGVLEERQSDFRAVAGPGKAALLQPRSSPRDLRAVDSQV
jgi:DNA-binding MarR family transcriptional regulator